MHNKPSVQHCSLCRQMHNINSFGFLLTQIEEKIFVTYNHTQYNICSLHLLTHALGAVGGHCAAPGDQLHL